MKHLKSGDNHVGMIQVPVALRKLLRNLFFLQHCCQLVRAGYGIRLSSGARTRSFFWIPHQFGHRTCDDDDTECQQASSVRGIDIVLLALFAVGFLCCCCACAYAWNKSRRMTRSEIYTHYVTMEDDLHKPPNQQLQNHIVVVKGEHVKSPKLVEMTRYNQQSTALM